MCVCKIVLNFAFVLSIICTRDVLYSWYTRVYVTVTDEGVYHTGQLKPVAQAKAKLERDTNRTSNSAGDLLNRSQEDSINIIFILEVVTTEQ